MSDYEQDSPSAEAAQRGIDAARARGEELGIEMNRVTAGREVEIAAADRLTLIAEGMQATDRARTTMTGRGGRETSVDELAGVIEDLSAHPWHAGPLRESVDRWVETQLDEAHQVVGGRAAVSEQVDSIESRGVTRVVGQLALDTDRAQVAAAVSSRPPAATVAPAPAAGPRGTHFEAAATASTKERTPAPSKDRAAAPARPEAAQLRGSERYAGSRTQAPRSQAPRGVER